MSKERHRRPGYDLYMKLQGLPLGRWIFTRMICFKAPYFSNIRPLFQELGPGLARVTMPKRRAVQNHIGTVHALAMGNLCELAAGLVTEASLSTAMRWIPRVMTIEYLRKAETALEATATIEVRDWLESSDVPVSVSVRDRQGREVVRATITMYVSPST